MVNRDNILKNAFCTRLLYSPDTMVTGPSTVESFCLVKFFIRHFKSVVFPTFGGPTMATKIGGGSTGVLSTKGM